MTWAMIIAGAAIGALAALGGAAWYLGGAVRDMDRYLHGDYADRYRHAGDSSWADDGEG